MQARNSKHFRAVVIGVSTGGVSALKLVLGALPSDFQVPILIVTHITPDADNSLAVLLDTMCSIKVKEADDLEVLTPGVVYLAPANYHLLVESDSSLALSVDPPVNFARPSADVLFESASVAYGSSLIGVVLTGAGNDGSKGLLTIKNNGGITIVQDPTDAEMSSMPNSALQFQQVDHIVKLDELSPLLITLLSGQA